MHEYLILFHKTDILLLEACFVAKYIMIYRLSPLSIKMGKVYIKLHDDIIIKHLKITYFSQMHCIKTFMLIK